jgi:DNA-binding Xre family transcriptional regulator
MSVLSQLLQEDLRNRRWSERQLARSVGVSPTTIGRLLNGEFVDMDTLTKACEWLGIKPSQALDSLVADPELADQLMLLVKSDPVIEKLLMEMVSRIERGSIPPSALKEAILFVMWKYSEDLTSGREQSERGSRDTELSNTGDGS